MQLLSLLAAAILMIETPAALIQSPSPGYVSPYSVQLTAPANELGAVDNTSPRSQPDLHSKAKRSEWYALGMVPVWGTWGPPAREFSPVANVSPDWERQRLVYTAANMRGLAYQHHHVPDWNPPENWPWKPVKAGRNGRGLDCSNFTSWVYNYGLGIKMTSAVREQANLNTVRVANGGELPVAHIQPQPYEQLVQTLNPGDLLYVRSKSKDEVSHVVMWLGNYAQSPDGTPLVIDCSDTAHSDCNGNSIPTGVQIRPFTRNSWYFNYFDHANRIIQ